MSSGDTFRAFYALPFEGEVARALEAAGRARVGALSGWRVTPAERIHLTLKFLGDTPVDLVPGLVAAMEAAAAAAGPFPIALSGWVPIRGVLSVGVSDPTGSLPRLAADLEGRAEALGFPREPRSFLPHVTVARNRNRTVPPPASGKGEDGVAETVADRILLMRSTLGPEGPTYAVVAEAKLQATEAHPRRSS